MSKQILLYPIVTEKSMSGTDAGRYEFFVVKDSTKLEIKDAVESMFKVKVASVNVLRTHGKKRMRRASIGMTPSKKKAIVSLMPGFKIDVISNV
ncbi:MAG TPA: 50S ribosomal protein L23 [Candidatus Cryosericum sp.]|jgi:large subunit ribosomal protein L23|nr:50S ribosomal protein L23 [Candidatus Cryosericum sp.]HOV50510.1 50S ribosomal protein L23 [Candidatus Cryosericum sp.]HPS70389.1 50S ribosomal protein L23 [Candidatus Cryosericum sp.]